MDMKRNTITVVILSIPAITKTAPKSFMTRETISMVANSKKSRSPCSEEAKKEEKKDNISKKGRLYAVIYERLVRDGRKNMIGSKKIHKKYQRLSFSQKNFSREKTK